MQVLLRTAGAAALWGAAFLAPGAASAATGYITNDTSLLAGPSPDFPPVAQIGAGAEVDVHGCLAGFSWCDVSLSPARGWVSGEDLEVLFQTRRVRVTQVTPAVVPAVTFSVVTYWDENYRSRPFYAQRDRFAKIDINVNQKNVNVDQKNITINQKSTSAAPAKSGSEPNANVNGNGTAAGGTSASNGSAQPCATGDKNCNGQSANANGGKNKPGTANPAATPDTGATASMGKNPNSTGANAQGNMAKPEGANDQGKAAATACIGNNKKKCPGTGSPPMGSINGANGGAPGAAGGSANGGNAYAAGKNGGKGG
jgi:uncharacterized protein YraI